MAQSYSRQQKWVVGEDIQDKDWYSGLVDIRAAKADGRWENAYVASEIKVPADFLAALECRPKAKQFFEYAQ